MTEAWDTMLAPNKQINTRTRGLSPAGLTDFINTLTLKEVDKAHNRQQHRDDCAKMYIPVPIKNVLGALGRASITMALPNSGNLLAHAAVDAEFHAMLGIPMKIQR